MGARNSPKTWRRVSPHSPVVTPALAQAMEGSMMLRPAAAASRKCSKRGGHRLFIARGAPGFQFFDLLEFDVLGNGENFFAIAR